MSKSNDITAVEVLNHCSRKGINVGDPLCDECDGSGAIECEECGGCGQEHDPECKCEECEHGESDECYACDGEGKVECQSCEESSRAPEIARAATAYMHRDFGRGIHGQRSFYIEIAAKEFYTERTESVAP